MGCIEIGYNLIDIYMNHTKLRMKGGDFSGWDWESLHYLLFWIVVL